MSAAADYDVVVVGAGFAGLYALVRLREMGLSARVLERGDGVGGTWFWNRYPGARCDVESVDYSYSFDEALEQEWEWTERYPAQPEILRYLNHVADRYDLRRDISLGTTVTAAHYDETANHWTIRTRGRDGGGARRLRARFCVMATGCLTSVNRPGFPGLEEFRGRWFHTARWPDDGVDFTGRRVGVIGTGSTGIQAIPRIAEQAAHLYVFQRTANFSMPARNAPLDARAQAEVKADYRQRRRLCRESGNGLPYSHPDVAPRRSTAEAGDAECARVFAERWALGGIACLTSAFNDITSDPRANALAAEFARGKIAEIVPDPRTARSLMPVGYPMGAKRVCVDTGYYETYNRDNVTLVDVRSHPIEGITPGGLRTTEREYRLDALVFATGFDAITGALRDVDIRGREGVPLAAKWTDGPRTYLGLATAGFPNLFLVTGPGSPSVLSNMVVSIEQHVDWIAGCLAALRDRGLDRVEATVDAEEAWVAHVNEVAAQTLFVRAESWYLGANIPGKPRIFMPYAGGVGEYRKICDEIAADGYRGFALSASGVHAGRPDGASEGGLDGGDADSGGNHA
jgi:cation diffusion facilitator CzcD-associated flavoprotein CzcO